MAIDNDIAMSLVKIEGNFFEGIWCPQKKKNKENERKEIKKKLRKEDENFLLIFYYIILLVQIKNERNMNK